MHASAAKSSMAAGTLRARLSADSAVYSLPASSVVIIGALGLVALRSCHAGTITVDVLNKAFAGNHLVVACAIAA